MNFTRTIKKLNRRIGFTFIGAYGTNLGDNAILLGMLKILDKSLKERGYVGNFFVFTNYPTKLEENLKKEIIKLESKVVFLKITNPLKLFFAIVKSDILVWGGGGLITEDWHFISNAYLVPIFLAHFLGKMTVAYSLGVIIPKSKLGQIILNMVPLDLISVRDPASIKAMKKLKKNAVVYLSPDPALLLAPSKEEIKKPKKEINLGISLRYIYSYKGGLIHTQGHAIEGITTFINKILSQYNELSIFFFPFNEHPSKWFENDALIGIELKKRIKKKKNFHILKNVKNPIEMLDKIQQCDLFIGNRLHSLILSLVAKTPFICFGGGKKVLNFLSMIGLSNYFISFNDKAIAERLEQLFHAYIKERKTFPFDFQKIKLNLSQQAERFPIKILEEYEKK